MNPYTWTAVLTLLIPIHIAWASQPDDPESSVPKVLYQSPFTEYSSHNNFERKSWYDANKQFQNTGDHVGHHPMSNMESEHLNYSKKPMPSQPSPMFNEKTHKHND